MPEFIKAYIVILFFSTIAFYFAKKVTVGILPSAEYNHFKNSWLILTSIAFLTFNYWVFLALSCLFVAVRVKKAIHPIGLYMAIVAAVPPITADMPGFGIMNYLMQVDYLMMLSVGLLLVLFLKQKASYLPLGRVNTDLFLITYLLLIIGLSISGTSITDILRQSVVLYLSVFLPYYVVSRSVQDVSHLKSAFAAYTIACFPLAFIGFFEAGKGWLVYSSLQSALNQYWGFGGYLLRDGALRASASFGHSIAFGYAMVVALGMYFFVQTTIKSKKIRFIGLAIMLMGLVAPLSRGPWVGAALMITVYLYLGKNGISNLIKFAIASLLALLLALATPMGDKVLNLIPFVGKTDSQNIDYRQELLDASLAVVSKSPMFGNRQYAKEPEMKAMVQGEQIIDLVNIYISVLLNSGLVGLFLYVGMFMSAGWMAYKSMNRIKSIHYELYQLGRSLIAILISIMLMISAMSNQLIIPYLYYTVIALCVAYSQIVKKELLLRKAG